MHCSKIERLDQIQTEGKTKSCHEIIFDSFTTSGHRRWHSFADLLLRGRHLGTMENSFPRNPDTINNI